MIAQALGSGLVGSLGAGAGTAGREVSPLSFLDYPRQAMYNVARPFVKTYRGESSDPSDLIAAIPGLLGGALAMGSFGTAMPLAGLLAMGGGQALGKFLGQPGFEAAKPSDLVEALGGDPESKLQNIIAGALTDPLTYTGLGAGRRMGGNIAEQMLWRGAR
jgi:hypothetical protein